MVFPADTFEEAVNLSITASNQLHTILNGDSTTEITVEDGSKIPSVRKAYTDSLFFLSPQPWTVGEYETVYNQLRAFVEPTGITTWWFSKPAAVSTPILMSTTPHEDTNWTLWNAINNSVYETQKRLAAEAGFNMVGSFLLGATVTTTIDVVFYESDGKYYSWGGVLPKTVVAGTAPVVGAGAWVDRTDVTLRSQVQNMVASAGGDASGVYDPAINYQTDTIGNAINRLITNNGVATPVSETSTLPTALSFSRKKEVRNAKPHADMPLDIHLSFEQETENTLNQISGTAYTINRNGYLKTTGTSSDQRILTQVSPKVPAFMVSAGVIFGGTATSYDSIKVGLMKDTSNWIMGQFNNKGNNISLSLTLAGTQYSSIELGSLVSSFSLADYDRIGMSMVGNIIGIWVRNKINLTWLLVSSTDITSAIDMHSASLSGWYYAMWSHNDAGAAQYFYDFKAGPFGYVGLRDLRLVTTHEGKPFLADDGTAYMTATCGCTGSSTAANAISSSYIGVFKIDLDTCELKQVGAIFVNRSSKILFDHAAKLIYDRTTESWVIMVSTWGDYYLSVNCDIGYATLDFNPLHGVNTITALTKLNYNGSVTVYDPDVIYYNGMWYLVYIKGLGGPVGVRSSSTFAGLFTAIEQTLTMTETAEGPIITVIGGALYILVGGLTAMAVYNSSLVKIGTLNLTYTAGMTNKWPHPTIIPVNKPGGTIYKIVTFNQNAYVSLNGTSNQFSWGDMIVFESNMVSGREY